MDDVAKISRDKAYMQDIKLPVSVTGPRTLHDSFQAEVDLHQRLVGMH